MDFSSSSSTTSPAFACTLDGQHSLPLLDSNDFYNSAETMAGFSWPGTDFYTVMEMNRLLEEMQQLESVDDSPAATPSSPVSSTDSCSFYCCQWVGCTCPVYTSLDSLVGHVMQDHVTSGKSSYTCGWAECPREGRPFAKRHKVMTHIRSHTGERPFACDVCGKRFARQDSLTTHTKLHVKKRSYSCTLAGCTQSFGQMHLLENHERNSHADQLAARLSDQPCDAVHCAPAIELDWTQLLSMDDCFDLLNLYSA